MSFTIQSASTPVWANASHLAIDLRVTFAEIGVEIPFTADGSDTEAHGREVFDRCVAGEFGPIAEYVAPPPLPPPPIAPISPRQIRQALTRAGLRTAVEAAVLAGDQDLKDWWEFSTSFERLNPQVVAMGVALGQSDAALDALWQLGASL